MAPSTYAQMPDSHNDISLIPQCLAKRPEMYHPTAINPYSQFISQLKDVSSMGAISSEDMIANCIYYGHMYHTSLMAVKVCPLLLTSIGKTAAASSDSR